MLFTKVTVSPAEMLRELGEKTRAPSSAPILISAAPADAANNKLLEAAKNAFPTFLKKASLLVMEALHTGAMRTTLAPEATLLLTAALVSAFKPKNEGTDTAAAARDAIPSDANAEMSSN